MIENDSIERIITCYKCGAKNRVGAHSDSLCPICGRCKARLLPLSKISKTKPPITFLEVIFSVFIVIVIVGVCYAIVVTPNILRKDFSALIVNEDEKIVALKQKQEEGLNEVEAELQEELSLIDAEKLRLEAVQNYKSIFDGRQSFDKRYALTSREKTQIRMRELASDSAKSYHQAISSVAQEASPKGADIRTTESLRGIALHIDFDMDSMTSGELGTRTKHTTKESLKKEVLSLISRVTNDVFQFCKKLELDTIHVGCRHHVGIVYPDGTEKVENTMLLKVVIRRSRVPTFSNNPFLDVYSTSQYLEVEEDNFSEIYITTTRL